jgi:hypothetical protein
MTDESIFICDPPPGPRWLLCCDHPISQELARRLREAWDQAVTDPQRSAIVIDFGLRVEVLPDRYEWPDAEFCAA